LHLLRRCDFSIPKALANGAAVLLFRPATAAFPTALALAVSALAISTFPLLTSSLAFSAPVSFAVLLPLPWGAVVTSIAKSCLIAVEILLLVAAVAAESASKVYLEHLFSDPLCAGSDLRTVRPLALVFAEALQYDLWSVISSSFVPLVLRWGVLMRGNVARTFSNTMSKISSSVNGLVLF
jgi:hypothetical protein